MDPPDTDELYFVADGAGGHVFSRSYDDQVRNVARWRAIEKQNAVSQSALPQPPVPTLKGRR